MEVYADKNILLDYFKSGL